MKPSLRTSRVVAKWKYEVRYFWVLLWGYLDDEGRGLDIPKTIAGDCFPLDEKVTPATINRWLDVIATTKVEEDREPPLCRYEVGGRRFIHSVYWGEHQRPNRPSASQHPQCPIHDGLTDPVTEPFTEPFTESVSEPPLSPHVLEFEGLTEGEFEGGGVSHSRTPPGPTTDQEPFPKCPKHHNHPDPPACRDCLAARTAHAVWAADRRARLAAAPKCRLHRGELAANCGLCRSEKLAAS
ncbi:MAG: hypothetical protein V4510_12035 [bacterium]